MVHPLEFSSCCSKSKLVCFHNTPEAHTNTSCSICCRTKCKRCGIVSGYTSYHIPWGILFISHIICFRHKLTESREKKTRWTFMSFGRLRVPRQWVALTIGPLITGKLVCIKSFKRLQIWPNSPLNNPLSTCSTVS